MAPMAAEPARAQPMLLPMAVGSSEMASLFRPLLEPMGMTAVAGGGVTKIPTILARPEIAAGRLVEVLPDWRGPAKDLFVVFPSARSVTTRLRAFLDVLREHVEAGAAARRQD